MFKRLILSGLLAAFLLPPSVASASAPDVPGLKGAIVMPFTLPADGTASLALYNRAGQLVRPLAQAVPLTKGSWNARWDGMDLWGNLLPAGTEFELRVYHSPGYRAFWEFAIAANNPVPWPTRPFGEGEAMRTGGWLGDHGVSASSVAVGDRLYFGSTMAEHGHTVIICNLEGEKLWGRGGLDGWVGPSQLASDGRAIFGVVKDNQLFRMSLDGAEVRRIAETGDDKIRALAAHDNKVFLILDNHATAGSLLSTRLKGQDFDFKNCLPVPARDKAHNRNLNGEEQFATTFFDGGHPQTGIVPTGTGPNRGIVAAFKKPVEIGTLLLERLAIPAAVEVYVLKPGTSYQPASMAPVPGEAPGSDWEIFGRSDLAQRMTFLTAPQPDLTTTAIYLRFVPNDAAGVEKWPRLNACRIFPQRLERVDRSATVRLPADGIAEDPQSGVQPGDTAWSFRVPVPFGAESAVPVILDYASPQTFDALVLLNFPNHAFRVDAWTKSGNPDPGDAAGWKEIAAFRAGFGQVEGSLSASQHSNDISVSLPETVTTRAVRLRVEDGMRPGRWNNPINHADPSLSRAADVALLRLPAGRTPESKFILQVRDGEDGRVLLESRDLSVTLTELAAAPDGKLYGAEAGKLYELTLPEQSGGPVGKKVLVQAPLVRPSCLAVSPDGATIAVGDEEAKAVFLFDSAGKLKSTIGGIGPRKVGPWDPRTVDLPGSIAIDKQGKVWVTERTYTPKRITRYAPDGTFEKEFLGPPHYGGGGALARDLKSFWYEAGEYAVDFAAGTSRLVALNDVQSNVQTATQEKGSYDFTKVGKPVELNGRRYLVGDVGSQYSSGFVVVRYQPETKTWKPAAVLARAQDNAFLVREGKEWRSHWLKQDLHDASFIWSDLNDDGVGQVEEVQLFKNADVMGDRKGGPFDGPYWGAFSGPDLTVWIRARLAPSGFTPGGAPIYRKEDIKPFSYEELAPVYGANMRFNTRAATGFGNVSMVTRDGALALVGQPYLVDPNLQIRGGNPGVEKPEYQPRIVGKIVDNPLSFLGSAETGGAVKEVAVINGVNGTWSLWAVNEGIMLGELFTGEAGGTGGITNPTRGMEMTGVKNDYETFFGYFTKADNGKYYGISGRGHFGITRIEGLDEIRCEKVPVQVPDSSLAENAALRQKLIANATVRTEKREMNLPALTAVAPEFAPDGALGEWDGTGQFVKLPGDGDLAFRAAWTPDDLVVAFTGKGSLANQNNDWKYAFKTGFGLEILLRRNAGERSETPVPGDKRLVVANFQGKWVGVLYDYVAGEGRDTMVFTSPVTSTRVDRVIMLPDDVFSARVVAPEAAGQPWMAEVRVAWKALGVEPKKDAKFLMDFGVAVPNSGGTEVDARRYWSNPFAGDVGDLAVEAEIRPRSFGAIILK